MDCTLCDERFSSAVVPRVLSCGHTLCTTCVVVFGVKGTALVCPFCQTVTPNFGGDATVLPTNFTLVSLAAAWSSKQPALDRLATETYAERAWTPAAPC